MVSLDSSLSSLNERQREAVTTTEGKLLVLAGAGSGKTRVLIERIAYLLSFKNVPPESILALTFTNKAAKEMRTRLLKRLSSLNVSREILERSKKNLTIATFHSFALRTLRIVAPAFGMDRRFTLYSEYDMRRLYQRLVREMLLSEGDLPSLQQTLALIDKSRSLRLDYQEIKEGTSELCKSVFANEEGTHRSFCASLLEKMRSALHVYRALDFQGLIETLVNILERALDADNNLCDGQVKALERLSILRYVMIDEYQDTDPVQDALAHSLAQLSAQYSTRDFTQNPCYSSQPLLVNLCVVGDDDQSIYAWRGAQIKNILEFPADHIVKLEQNYRSTKTILRAANAVIGENTERFNKQLWSSHNEGEKIDIWHAPTEVHEARSICERIVALYGKGVPFTDIAVLYRSNKLKGVLEGELMRSTYVQYAGIDSGTRKTGIPYQVFGGQSLYESKEVLDLQNYMKMLLNPKDDLAFLATVNHPRRGIGDAAITELTQVSKEKSCSLQEGASAFTDTPTKRGGSLSQFSTWCTQGREALTHKPLPEALSWILNSINYDRSIDQEVKSEKMRLFKRKNLSEYLEQAKLFAQENDKLSSLDLASEFLSTTSLDKAHSGAMSKKERDSVSLMTLHSSKGLEFPYVFVMGLEDGLIPHERAVLEGGKTALEEERRLLYVGLTRGEKRLFLSMCQRRTSAMQRQQAKDSPEKSQNNAFAQLGQKRAPSRFLTSLPKDVLRVVDYRWNHLT